MNTDHTTLAAAAPESLAAILAEFRKFALRAAEEDKTISPENVLLLADKVEAAAREREELIRVANETMEAVHADARQHAAPGNAAAMRHALGIVYDWILKAGNVHGYPDTEQKRRQLYDMMTKALSAPPRNCDRFASAEKAVAAFADHLRAWENAHGIHSEYPDHPVQVPAGAFAWLFDKAEGGDHA